MKHLITLCAICFIVSASFAQEQKKSLSLNAYIDAYYGHFTDNAPGLGFQKFATACPVSNKIGLNIAQISLHYQSNMVRSNIGFHHGDIVNAIWDKAIPFVQEANIGIQLFENWWFDIGLFTTHIGTESFLPKNNLLSSTALATYNEPFYQGGAKLSYEGFENASLEIWAVNGYNQFIDVNKKMSFGVLLGYDFTKNIHLTYTNIIGNEEVYPATVNAFLVYHNAYLNMDFNKLSFIVGGDLGTYKTAINGIVQNQSMYNMLATIRHQTTKKFSTTVRYERFNDPYGFISGIVNTTNATGLNIQAVTAGTEYKPTEKSYIRAEWRYLFAPKTDQIFTDSKGATNVRNEVLFTMGHYFDTKLF